MGSEYDLYDQDRFEDAMAREGMAQYGGIKVQPSRQNMFCLSDDEYEFLSHIITFYIDYNDDVEKKDAAADLQGVLSANMLPF